MTPPTNVEARAHQQATGHEIGSIPALSAEETFYACLDCPWPLNRAESEQDLIDTTVMSEQDKHRGALDRLRNEGD